MLFALRKTSTCEGKDSRRMRINETDRSHFVMTGIYSQSIALSNGPTRVGSSLTRFNLKAFTYLPSFSVGMVGPKHVACR